MPNASVMVMPLLKRLSGLRSSLNSPRSSRRARDTKALNRAVMDTLEPRQLMSVSMNNGWTEISPPAGAKVIYVSSSSGNDGSNGLSASSPVRSINRAKNLMRSGAGDQMLLKRGDTFRESFGFWGISGRDSNNPTLIGAYGSGNRPVISAGGQTAFNTSFSGLSNVAIIGLKFDGSSRGGKTVDGILSIGKVNNFLIEDCEVKGYRNNLDFEDYLGPSYNLKVRRSTIVDSWSRNSHSQGLYADGIHGILLEGNTFDHNGWGNGAGQTMFNHNAYITAKSSGLTAKDNVFSNASSHGLQARPGGNVTGNAFINNGVGLSYGLVNGSGIVKAGGVVGTVSNNVFYGGHKINGVPAGVGVEMSNIKSATLSDNLFLFGDVSTPNPAISLSNIRGTTNRSSAVGIAGLAITNNVVYGWNQGLAIGHGLSVKSLQVRGNDFQALKHFQAITNYGNLGGQNWSGNRYNVPINRKNPIIANGKGMTIDAWAATKDSGAKNTIVSYPDKSRSPNKYAGDFLARARSLSKSNWDSRYTASPLVAYMRGGFRGGNTTVVPPVGGGSVDPTPAPTTPTQSAGDSKIKVSVGDISATEGSSGYKNFTFTISLSAKSSKTVAVKWETKGLTAKVGGDYVGKNGTATFAPGVTKKYVTIQVKADKVKEATEQFMLNLLSATNASIADNQGKATVTNDDGTSSGSLGIPSSGNTVSSKVSINDVSSTEGNNGYKNFTFTVSLSSAASSPVNVKWETKGSGAKVGSDYIGKNGTLTFGAGQSKKYVTIQVKSDKVTEGNEAFYLNLINTNASFADAQGKATIINDDGKASGSL